ncbi:MAG: DUF4399 domain-containing protein [Rhodothermales bacterium]
MTSKKILSLAFLSVLVAAWFIPQVAIAQLPRTPSPEGTMVYIIAPQDGAAVSGAVTVRFGLKGMGVAPAGIDYPDSGHHHLLFNAATLPPTNLPIPSDDHHLHFGKGQTETTLQLEPGTYTLQLLLGDKNHVPHDPPVVSEKVTITVK